MQTNTLIRYLTTLLLLALAVWLGKALWDHYMHSPWTRDGRVRADVITLSADVAGLVTQVAVKDNQPVHKGDVLFVVDRARYAAALAQAEAALDGQRTEKNRRSKEAARRDSLDSAVVSAENRETASFAAAAAGSQYQAALAARDLARLNLERTVVRAPADGYVTNLNVHVGDFAAVGAPKLALIDRNSYRVEGYFEETKLPLLKLGAKVEITLLSGGPTLRGHVASIARGITDRDAGTGRELLADVNPTFNWVRLAQRVPVRIELDTLPAGQVLVAGTTCTVVVR
ncbi:efflux RND transporter periplasmic adaptor subunit [Chromobacterium haemolyticum]|uniref:Efflux RND transporter periplasmic adaptor subunit n=1 Tax=Chromobacterium haemolyticum TaxID=394935 RepID=A0ABS3GKR0_9NEIS|nr:efflux RND transporter periplasmic adaptor subunit [Chromobacterium haemolyticum]MBK0414255.1 efflux RND transporter periplasmic adaptor subunit [Chromobacterium haemolyticum]MBO0415634.1 efflux RND transporter periplasmic adaptor subunit [Chromobacterium haemolyticum]MBO0498850.1 efflux RND transporter periplasmic adaptor subunit [Chromobacterium haemolyticum]